MSKDESKTKEKPKGSKVKKMILISFASVTLLGAGIGGGLYAAGQLEGSNHEEEDPNRPKLVKRTASHEDEASAEGGEGKEAPLKEGTVSVKSDTVKIDPKLYQATYFPLEQSFTANLADGAGFVQVGLSIATYYDGKVIMNIKREMVPIRSAILMVLSEQNIDQLSTPQGKELLQKELTSAINDVLRKKEGFGGIENVYFTNLVIQ